MTQQELIDKMTTGEIDMKEILDDLQMTYEEYLTKRHELLERCWQIQREKRGNNVRNPSYIR